jgi:hypothetical protein
VSSADVITIDCLLIADILCIGDIGSQRIRRDSFFSDWIVRVGLPWDLQFDARIPFGYMARSIGFADGTTDRADVLDIGDVELSLTSVKVRDPIVLFTNFSAYPLRSAKD